MQRQEAQATPTIPCATQTLHNHPMSQSTRGKTRFRIPPDDIRTAIKDQELPPIHSPHRRSTPHGNVQHIPVRPYPGSTPKKHRHDRHTQKAKDKAVQLRQQYEEEPEDYFGWTSPWAWLWGTIFLSIPVAYVYIGLVLLREICRALPAFASVVEIYLPPLAQGLRMMSAVSWVVEMWCILEGVFYVALKLHMRWLQTRDTLEASLSAAPLMDLTSRRVLWQRMMETEADDTAAWVRGWLLDAHPTREVLDDLKQISLADMKGFVCWSMFEGRRIEHLTIAESSQLDSFVHELQIRLSLQFYGATDDSEGDEDDMAIHNVDESDAYSMESTQQREDFPALSLDSGYDPWKVPRFVHLPTPKKGTLHNLIT